MKNQTSQQLLGSLCLFLSCMLWACGSGSSSSDPSAPEMLSAAAPASSNGFQIVMQNQSTQFANSDIYWTAVCQNQSGAYCYIDSTGSLIPMSLADNTVSLGTAKNCNDTTTFANYSYPLASLDTLSIPGGSYINSAILYLSVDSFLPICVNKNSAGVITYAPPSFSNPSLQGYNTIFQAVEWTYNINADNTLNINTTNVDEVGMMILLELQDSNTLDSVGFKVSRSNLIQQFAACQDTNFRSLIIPGTSGDTLRILSPEHVMAGMGISSNVVQYFNDFYTDYIDDCWTFYNNKTITIYNNSKSFTGKLMRDTFFFNPGTTFGSPAFFFTKPSSSDVLSASGEFTEGSTDQKNVGKVIASAIYRTVFMESPSDPSDSWCGSSMKQKYFTNAPINYYGLLLHNGSHQGLCYTYGYSDVCSESASLASTTTQQVTLRIRD